MDAPRIILNSMCQRQDIFITKKQNFINKWNIWPTFLQIKTKIYTTLTCCNPYTWRLFIYSQLGLLYNSFPLVVHMPVRAISLVTFILLIPHLLRLRAGWVTADAWAFWRVRGCFGGPRLIALIRQECIFFSRHFWPKIRCSSTEFTSYSN